MIRHAWRRVSTNKGKRSAGVDGITVDRVRQRIGEQVFLEGIRKELRSGAYRPSPSRRKLIPKAGKPGQFRPLGIPTVNDRVVQGAVKAVLEPIFEANSGLSPTGFGPERGRMGPWSMSGYPCCRGSGTRTADGTRCRLLVNRRRHKGLFR